MARYCIDIFQAAKVKVDWGDDHLMSTANNSQISYIRFGAVQLGQRGRSEQPLPLAKGQHSTLTGSHGATGQRLGAAGQLPGCVRSVCGWKIQFWLWTVSYYKRTINSHYTHLLILTAGHHPVSVLILHDTTELVYADHMMTKISSHNVYVTD